MAVVGGAVPVAQTAAPLSDGQLLLQAVLRAADELELNRAKGIEPASKIGELALLLIRLYRSLGSCRQRSPPAAPLASHRQPPYRRLAGRADTAHRGAG